MRQTGRLNVARTAISCDKKRDSFWTQNIESEKWRSLNTLMGHGSALSMILLVLSGSLTTSTPMSLVYDLLQTVRVSVLHSTVN